MTTNTNNLSKMDIMAMEIADIYRISNITAKKSAVSTDYFHGTYIPDAVSRIPGYLDLNMMLRYAADYYSPKVVRNATEDKELATLKAKVGPFSAHVDRLEREYFKSNASNTEKNEMHRELIQKKEELDVMRERLGELSTKKNVVLQSEKLSIVKRAFKILSAYNKKKPIAVQLFEKIKGNLIVKSVAQTSSTYNQYQDQDVYNEDDYDNHEASAPASGDHDGWTKVAEKKNPFASMNEKYAKKTGAWSAPNGGAGAPSKPQSSVNIDELIKKFHEKKYLTPAQRNLVLAELEKREKEADESEEEEYPTLGGIAPVPKKSTGMNFAEMAAKVPISEVIELPQPKKKILAETMIKGKKVTLVEMESEEPEIISQTVRDGFRFTEYQFPDGSTFTVSAPTQSFYDAIESQNEYRQYLHEVNNKPWLKGMDYDEWCEFKDECAYMQELEYQREMEKYSSWGLKEYIPESAHKHHHYDENDGYDDYDGYDGEDSNCNQDAMHENQFNKKKSYDNGITA